MTFPRGKSATQHPQIQQEGTPAPWRDWGGAFGREGGTPPYKTKGNGRITQKDLQLFRASPHASGWSGNIHESKLSDIYRSTQSRLPIGRLKSYKYKKSAYGGKKSPARAGKKGLPHRCYALHDNQDYTSGCFCTGESRTF